MSCTSLILISFFTKAAFAIVTDGEPNSADVSQRTSLIRKEPEFGAQKTVDHNKLQRPDNAVIDDGLEELELEEGELSEDEFVVGDMSDSEVDEDDENNQDEHEDSVGLKRESEIARDLVGSNSSTKDDGAFEFAGYWSDYGGGWGKADWYRRGDLCFLNGLVKVSRRRAFNHKHIGTLDPTCRPTKRLIFSMNNHQYTTRVDVLPDGKVMAVGGQHHHHWLSLTGIQFVGKGFTTGHKTIPLGGRWRHYGGSYSAAKYYVDPDNGYCILQGLIKHDHTNSQTSGEIARLPAECRPHKRLIFNACQQDRSGRVDVHKDGRITWHTGSFGPHKWVSLAGMLLYTRPNKVNTKTVLFRGGFTNYGGEYGNVEYHAATSMLCVADGLVRGHYRRRGHANEVYFGNEPQCKPSKALIFNMNNHAKSYRLDVHPNGWMYWTAEYHSSSNDHNWMSISSVTMPGRER